ncbi:MAG: polysaccharide deacetylase family protein [Bacillota bacterium]
MSLPIPILLYHRIDNAKYSTSTSPLLFRQHLQWLKERGWRSLSADEFCFAMMTGRSFPARSFLITFDDGYESIRSTALAILREFDCKAISFLSTAFLRNPDDKCVPLSNIEHPEHYLSWTQARELQSSGIVDCQSHSHGHNNFTTYSAEKLKQDLAMSIYMLASELRLPKSHFSHLAWPWGLSQPAWRGIATAIGFKYQYGVSRQSARVNCPLDQIPRTCFDASSFSQFQRQVWLQSSHVAPIWDLAYPLGRKLRQFSSRIRNAA